MHLWSLGKICWIPVFKFGENLLYFQYFMQIFVFAQNQWLSPP